MTLAETLNRIWRLRWPLLASHAAVTLMTLALIAPLLSGALHLGLRLSGQPALADMEIAAFLLSPAGAVVLLAAGSLMIAAAVLDVAVMMTVLAQDRRGAVRPGLAALAAVAARMPQLVRLAAWLILRVLVLALPFAAAVAAIAALRLTEHDINYYLATRPPELVFTIRLGGAILALGAALLLWRLLGWSLALPAVLLGRVSGGAAFGASRRLVAGQRRRLVALLVLWAVAALAVTALVGLAAGGLARLAALAASGGTAQLVAGLSVVLLVWAALMVAATTLTRAALAALLLDRYLAGGGPVAAADRRPAAAPSGRRMALLAGAAVVLAAGSAGAGLVATLGSPDSAAVIAHRAGAGLAPENTLAALSRAIEDGADWVEIDVQENADGTVVVWHDSDFMRAAGDPRKVWNTTDAELADIDIGTSFDPAFADQRVATLAQVLAASKDRVKVLIELKYYGHTDRLEARVAEAVEAAGMTDQIALMSLEPAGVAAMKALRPDWQVGLLAATGIGDLTRLNVDFLALRSAMASPAFLRHAGQAGRPVFVWTVNDAVAMSQMLSRGADGLITDYPALARKVLADRAELTTPERLLLELAAALDVAPRQPDRTMPAGAEDE